MPSVCIFPFLPDFASCREFSHVEMLNSTQLIMYPVDQLTVLSHSSLTTDGTENKIVLIAPPVREEEEPATPTIKIASKISLLKKTSQPNHVDTEWGQTFINLTESQCDTFQYCSGALETVQRWIPQFVTRIEVWPEQISSFWVIPWFISCSWVLFMGPISAVRLDRSPVFQRVTWTVIETIYRHVYRTPGVNLDRTIHMILYGFRLGISYSSWKTPINTQGEYANYDNVLTVRQEH